MTISAILECLPDLSAVQLVGWVLIGLSALGFLWLAIALICAASRGR